MVNPDLDGQDGVCTDIVVLELLKGFHIFAVDVNTYESWFYNMLQSLVVWTYKACLMGVKIIFVQQKRHCHVSSRKFN